jgi:hypothetical protein
VRLESKKTVSLFQIFDFFSKMWENAYNLDVALSIIANVRGLKSIEWNRETDPDKRREMWNEIELINREREILYAGGEKYHSVMDKVFKCYAPALKARYVACSETK